LEKDGFVYILTNSRKTVLYIGVTTNLERRLYEHSQGLIDGFTKRYNVKHLVYYEQYNNIGDAIVREKSLKGKTRKKKEILIDSLNQDWKDLSLELF
jgi:putative endonuclease